MQKIYLIEDDENIRDLIVYALESAEFAPSAFENGACFFEALQRETPDLVLLDIMLPGEDGLAILKRLRGAASTEHLPVIMVTAKGSEYDRVRGLDLGADDYIIKPFSVLELISRVKALLRRTAPSKGDRPLCFGDITVDVQKYAVTAAGQPATLTLKEFDLLCYLLQNTGIVLSRDKIMNHVWGFDYEGESRTVDMHVKTLRQKLGGAGEAIKTIRGVGYKLGD